MKKQNALYRTILIAIITIGSLYAVIGPRQRPKASDFTWSGIKANLRNNLNLGLDLRGGTHLVMQVQTAEYLQKLAENASLAIKKAAEDDSQPFKDVRYDASGGNYRVILEANDASKVTEIRDAIEKKGAIQTEFWSSNISGNTVTWSLSTTAQRHLSEQAVIQAENIIKSRIDTFGVTEPTLQRHGSPESHQILLQMPGLTEPERVKELIKVQAKLYLVHVIGAANPSPVQTYNTQEEALATFGGSPPSNRKVMEYQERDDPTDINTNPNVEKPKKWVIVEWPEIVNGDELRDANAVSRTGNDNDYQITFSLKKAGADKFGTWTGANINQYMGVVLENAGTPVVKSIAYIKSQIYDSGEISGSFTKTSAEDLALTLRSGALPASIKFQEERTVGPSLGDESIRAGVWASVAGLLFIILFMLFYYRGAGVNAVLALLLNTIITLAALVFFDATLTLPGIAGLILSIGMAVDSNVLIFERIREELRSGKTVTSAVDVGFSRVFVTLIDTHVTTIISCLFLFVFGTGPIRGFAVMLVLGLLANLFTAVYVSRTIFMWILGRKGRQPETISI
jgi:preprotein translocase subunit SecD